MPNIKSAAKRVKQSEKRRIRNKMYKTRFKNAVKKVLKAMEEKQPKEKIMELVKEAQSALDKAVSKGAIHKNQASRRKARLMAKVNAYLKSLEG